MAMNEQDMPEISVIIPTYNNGRFINSALESIFRQTYPEKKIEIIVVDDGSTDNTPEVLEEFREKIIYVRQENNGIASARNTGMSMAKGEIITFLDSDDMWYEERVQRVVERFNERYDTGMVYHPVEVIDSDGTTIYDNFYKAFGYKEGLHGCVTNEILSGWIFCGGSSFAFKREIIDKIYPVPEDIRRGIDYYMTAVSSCHATVEYIPAILGKYRMHGSNLTMFAGHENSEELSLVNRDFAHMRQKIVEKIQGMSAFMDKTIDVNIVKRIQAKETIFCSILNGQRVEGIKCIPALFKGNQLVQELFKAGAITIMALLVPARFYPNLVRFYGEIKRIISF